MTKASRKKRNQRARVQRDRTRGAPGRAGDKMARKAKLGALTKCHP